MTCDSGFYGANLRIEFPAGDASCARVSIVDGEARSFEIELHDESADEALVLLRRLNAWRFADGRRVSEHIVVDGFEPWWFIQEALFWYILLPYTRFRAVLELILQGKAIEVVDPPGDLRRLLRILAEADRVPPLQFAEKASGLSTRMEHWRIKAIGMAEVLVSLISLLIFRLGDRKILLYAIDKVTPGLKHDFRLHAVYQELAARGTRFGEYVHVGDAQAVLSNLRRRGRPVVFFEALASALHRLWGSPSGSGASEHGAAVFDGDTESAFLESVARHALGQAARSAFKVRCIRTLLRFWRPRVALVLDDGRHAHELVAACRSLGIYVLGYQHGLGLNRFSVGLMCYGFGAARRHAFDSYGLWSEYFCQKLVRCSELYDRSNTFVCGNLRPPKRDVLRPTAQDSGSVEKPVRVLVISEPRAVSEEVVPHAARLVNDTRFELLLKLRPGEKISHDYWGDVARHIQPLTTSTVYEAFEQADVVVGMFSSVLYEAILARKPVVILKSSSPFAPSLPREGLAEWAESPDDIQVVILRARALPGEELERRRDVVWGDSAMNAGEALFAKIPVAF